jgi:hypothetical protein
MCGALGGGVGVGSLRNRFNFMNKKRCTPFYIGGISCLMFSMLDGPFLIHKTDGFVDCTVFCLFTSATIYRSLHGWLSIREAAI